MTDEDRTMDCLVQLANAVRARLRCCASGAVPPPGVEGSCVEGCHDAMLRTALERADRHVSRVRARKNGEPS